MQLVGKGLGARALELYMCASSHSRIRSCNIPFQQSNLSSCGFWVNRDGWIHVGIGLRLNLGLEDHD